MGAGIAGGATPMLQNAGQSVPPDTLTLPGGIDPNNPQAQTVNAIGQAAATPGAMPVKGKSAASRYATNAGLIANALQPLLSAMPGPQQQGQQPQRGGGFAAPQMPYIPPPALNNNFYGG